MKDNTKGISLLHPSLNERNTSTNEATSLLGEDFSHSWPASFDQGMTYRLASPYLRKQTSRFSNERRTKFFSQTSGDSTFPPDEDVESNNSFFDENDNTGSTFFQAIFNAVNLLLGVGVLSLPFALRSSGYAIALPLLLFVAFVTNYSGKLLGRCLEYSPGMCSYPDIGEAAFGTTGRSFISLIFFTELFTACTMFIVLIGDNLHKIFPSLSESELMLIGFLIILPTTWTSHLSFLSYFSIIGIISSFFLLFVMIYLGAINTPEQGNYFHPREFQIIADSDRIPMCIGLTMVGFAGHAVFPSIYCSMKDKSLYPRMLDFTYILVLIVYGIIEVLGYLMYGLSTTKEITLNLMDSNVGYLSVAVTWMIALNPASKYALTLNPVALSLEEIFFSKQFESSSSSCLLRIALRSFLGFLSLLCALYIPYFARVTSFLGSLFSLIVSAIFPCCCYLKLYESSLSSWERWINYFIIIISSFLVIIGTFASFYSPDD